MRQVRLGHCEVVVAAPLLKELCLRLLLRRHLVRVRAGAGARVGVRLGVRAKARRARTWRATLEANACLAVSLVMLQALPGSKGGRAHWIVSL
eukprot:scaffold125126_cov60-Phaeocystis_antarctica.AAC.2